jgi:hypothetical protein
VTHGYRRIVSPDQHPECSRGTITLERSSGSGFDGGHLHRDCPPCRWRQHPGAHNTVTTNGDADEAQLSIVSIIGRRVGSIAHAFSPERLDELVQVRGCCATARAADYMPVLGGTRAGGLGRP